MTLGFSFPQIVYIMGTGRSGTTILEILLSTSGDICSAGEITHIFKDGFLNNNKCACSKPTAECAFWKSVNNAVGYKGHEEKLQKASLFRRLDWHKNFFLVAVDKIAENDFCEYKQTNEKLFKACSINSGKRIIIDSSKYASRALMLKKCFGDNVKIICLTRSPEGIIKAFSKKGLEQNPKKPFAIFLYYTYVLLCCSIVSRIAKGVLFVSFESLTKDPVRVLQKIETSLEIDCEDAKKKINNYEPFRPGHIVTGNRIRKKNDIYFKIRNKSEIGNTNNSNVFLWPMKILQKLLKFDQTDNELGIS